ncbi:MAG: hypothetical protein VKO26_06560 [Cyanobacteriota bacterium]|nr:hypothetical protein [Cyanobacteriota bacterium]
MIPICQGFASSGSDAGRGFSHTLAVRQILSILPTQNVDAASAVDGACRVAPFSRNQQTHFCRLVVIDNLTFVGRQHEDAILTAIRKKNPVIPGPVDHLPNDFLAFIVDFDAADDRADTLKAYLQGLWQEMPRELTAIFRHCEGFDRASPCESFIRQVMEGQIETTMSYNDYYWTGEPGLWAGSPALPNKLPSVLILPLGAALVGVIACCWLGPAGPFRLLLIGSTLALALHWLVRRLIHIGMQPFPTAPRSDLPSVLKALYLQRQFIAFMIANQGSSPDALKASFIEFLQQHQPQSVHSPTQAPASLPF